MQQIDYGLVDNGCLILVVAKMFSSQPRDAKRPLAKANQGINEYELSNNKATSH